ncbi:MAG: hypothetical protein IPF83_08665 [Rhodanobacteraceae bacterium]|jgi:glutamate 5-kinase|nr:hypothetical protein [Rhodanobacteraceae bacterium]MBK7044838.1 hypothetical protein [Rhodanobacteraceae bacterium]MBP9155827.1 hypothetical protein [Xanthomonadales bacterium]
MKGSIYVNAAAGRALRIARRSLRLSDVVDCAGNFCSDDKINIVIRQEDGSQSLVATSRVEFSFAQLRHALKDQCHVISVSASEWDDLTVCKASKIEWLWTQRWNE